MKLDKSTANLLKIIPQSSTNNRALWWFMLALSELAHGSKNSHDHSMRILNRIIDDFLAEAKGE